MYVIILLLNIMPPTAQTDACPTNLTENIVTISLVTRMFYKPLTFHSPLRKRQNGERRRVCIF
jgi:hypothetical protein